MNINKELIDELNIIVSVHVEKDDYETKVNDILRDYRRKANMPGFRPGKVPEGLIRKMYGKAVLLDEINKITSESLQNYIKNEQLKVLGDPIPKIDGEEYDWEIGNDFTFEFDMGLAPKIEVNLSKEDRFAKYKIIVDDDFVDKHIENYLKRFGQFVDADAVVDFKEKIVGDIVQLADDGQQQHEGMSAEDTSLLLSLVNDDELKKPFENAAPGSEIVFNLSKTFPNDWEIASILKKSNKDEVGDVDGLLFKFSVKTIQKFINAELNQELFDKILGENVVTSTEEFKNKMRELISLEFEKSSVYKLNEDIRKYLLEKIDPQLPEEFLGRWLKYINKDTSDEAVEKELPLFLKNTKWELIANAIIEQNEMKVEENEIIEHAKAAARNQFTSYGISNFSDEHINNFAMNYLKEEKNVRTTATQILENKVSNFLIEAIDADIQEISMEEFNTILGNNNQQQK